MCSPQPDQVTFPQDEQVTGEHIGASSKLSVYLAMACALGGIKTIALKLKRANAKQQMFGVRGVSNLGPNLASICKSVHQKNH